MNPDLEPYPAYKDSGVPWLGDIPAHWQQSPGRACFVETKTPNVGMQETTVLSLSYGQIVVRPPEKLHGLVPASFETYQIIEPYDIVIRPTDLQNDWVSLRTGLARTRGIITSAYMRLRTKDSLAPEYGHLLLHAYDLKKVFYGLGSGLRQNLSWRDFKYLPCLVPSPGEQAAIVRFLDYVDRRIRRYIRAKKKLIALLEEQKQAFIQRAVTRGLDPNVRLKPSGVEWLGEMPEQWQVVSLGVAADSIQTGPFGSQLHASEYVTGGIPVINPSHMRDGRIQFDPAIAISKRKARELERHALQAGDVVMARRGELGRCALVCEAEDGWLCGTGSLRIRPKSQLFVSEYLVLLLGSPGVRDMLSLSSIGATMNNLNAGMVGQLRLPRPHLQEQRQVVEHINSELGKIQSALFGAQREIDLIREYRTCLIADVVTGKLDVREAAANLPDEADVPEDWDADGTEEESDEDLAQADGEADDED